MPASRVSPSRATPGRRAHLAVPVLLLAAVALATASAAAATSDVDGVAVQLAGQSSSAAQTADDAGDEGQQAPATPAPPPAPQPTPGPDADRWPSWRGPLGTGESPGGRPPVEWSEEKNVRWKAAIPGRGHSSPVVWGDRVFVLTAVPSEGGDGVEAGRPHRFELLALARKDGRFLWRRTLVEEAPHEGTHPDGTWASASPVTDGEVVIASFGSRGLFGYTVDGKRLWSRDLGDMSTRSGFGEGSSPALAGDKVVVNWDHEGDSFIVALDRRSGWDLWRQKRDEITSWSTPVIVQDGAQPQVVVAATGATRGYDLATGEVLWELAGMTVNTVPTPVVADGIAYVTSGFRGNALQAIRLGGARGDLAGSDAVLWTRDRDTPYVPSPLLYRGRLYFLKSNSGILTAIGTADGGTLFSQRLPEIDGVYASPVAADGRVYVAGRDGTTVVLAAGDAYEVLAVNTLDEGFDASPAVAGEELYLRGRKYLYCLAED